MKARRRWYRRGRIGEGEVEGGGDGRVNESEEEMV